MIISDIVESQSLKRSTDGFTAERSFIVDGVGGNAESKLYTALTTSGIPQFGDQHPYLPEVVATSITAVPLKSGEQIKINVSYTVPDPEEAQSTVEEDDITAGTFSINSSTAAKETHFDINGDLLAVEWKGLISTVNFVTPVNVQRPQLSVQFRRTESTTPKDSILNFLGRVNSVPWSGFPKKTWLCSGITARENQGVFDVDYTFTYNEDDWRAELIPFLSPDQAKEQPPDKDQNNGYAVFDVYLSADFNSLGLSF